MPVPLPLPQPGSPPVAAEGGGAACPRDCPLSEADGHVCGCLNPAAPEGGLVSVISADAAVRRALVLLLEAEGLTARAFCTLPALLGVMELAPAPQRHCLVIEEEQARGIDASALGGHVSVVVLTGNRPPVAAPGRVAFVDPFGVDEVLRAIRSALG